MGSNGNEIGGEGEEHSGVVASEPYSRREGGDKSVERENPKLRGTTHT